MDDNATIRVLQIRANEYCYKGKPRLRTGYELLRVSTEIEQTLNEVCQILNILFKAKLLTIDDTQ